MGSASARRFGSRKKQATRGRRRALSSRSASTAITRWARRLIEIDVDRDRLLRRRRRALADMLERLLELFGLDVESQALERRLGQRERLRERAHVFVLRKVELLVSVHHGADQEHELLSIFLAVAAEYRRGLGEVETFWIGLLDALLDFGGQLSRELLEQRAHFVLLGFGELLVGPGGTEQQVTERR